MAKVENRYYVDGKDSPARVVIEGFPADLHRTLKILAATGGTTVKELLIAAARLMVKIGVEEAIKVEPKLFKPRKEVEKK